jgi:hypothetical protein
MPEFRIYHCRICTQHPNFYQWNHTHIYVGQAYPDYSVNDVPNSASSSLQLLNQILIADLTTLRMRGLIISLSTVFFLLNTPIGSFVSAAFLQNGNWRLGCS